MKNHEKDAKNRARSNTGIERRAGGSVPGLDDKRLWYVVPIVLSPPSPSFRPSFSFSRLRSFLSPLAPRCDDIVKVRPLAFCPCSWSCAFFVDMALS